MCLDHQFFPRSHQKIPWHEIGLSQRHPPRYKTYVGTRKQSTAAPVWTLWRGHRILASGIKGIARRVSRPRSDRKHRHIGARSPSAMSPELYQLLVCAFAAIGSFVCLHPG